MRKVKDEKEHNKLLKAMILRILNWPLPGNTTVEKYSLPRWLAEDSKSAIRGFVADEEYLDKLQD